MRHRLRSIERRRGCGVGALFAEVGDTARADAAFAEAVALTERVAVNERLSVLEAAADYWSQRTLGDGATAEARDQALAIYEAARTAAVEAADNYRLWIKTARLKAAIGDAQAALEALDAAIDVAPEVQTAWLRRAEFWRALNDDEAAERDYAAALATASGPAERAAALRGRALLRVAQSRLDAAIDDLDQATTRAPDDALTWRVRAKVLSRAARRQDARRSFDRALALRPDWLVVRVERGQLFHDMQEHTAAIADFDSVLAKAGDDVRARALATNARFFRGLSRFYLGRVERAFADLDAVVSQRGDDPLALLWRGRAALRLGRADDALADFDRSFPQLSRSVIATYQQRLINRGFDLGAADGVYGPATRSALVRCAASRCL